MKNGLLNFLLLFCFLSVHGQEKKTIGSGNITIVTNQKMNFKNLRFQGDEVKFFNTATQSEFTYFLNSVRSIQDNDGHVVYSKTEEAPLKPRPKPKLDWIEEKDSLRDNKKVRAEIIFRNGDTLKTHVKVSNNLIDPTLLDPLSVNRKIKSFTANVKTSYSAEDIARLRFIDYRETERIFIANDKELVELLFDGKIRWYRTYDSYRAGEVSSADFLIDPELKKAVGLSGFSNRRKNLKEITKARPDLIPLIENMKINDQTILALLKKYEQ